MKISELIRELEEVMAKYGDVTVVVEDDGPYRHEPFLTYEYRRDHETEDFRVHTILIE